MRKKAVIAVMVVIGIVVAAVLFLGINQIRGKGIAFTNMDEIRDTKQLIKEYVLENCEESLEKFDLEQNFHTLTEMGLTGNMSLNRYMVQCLENYTASRAEMKELGITIEDYSFHSISKTKESGYSIVYDLDIRYEDTVYKNIYAEFVGSEGKFLFESMEWKYPKEEGLLDLLNSVMFQY